MKRELTFDEVLTRAGAYEALDRAERLRPEPASMGCSGHEEEPGEGLLSKPLDRRGALGALIGSLAVTTQAIGACTPGVATDEEREAKLLERDEYFKNNYRRMTPDERRDTVRRLERLAALRGDADVRIRTDDPIQGVMYGYAFNISKCKGFRNCVEACIDENNLDRATDTQYIRIFEKEVGSAIDDLSEADATYGHEVPGRGALLHRHAVLPMREPSLRLRVSGASDVAGARRDRRRRLRLVHRVSVLHGGVPVLGSALQLGGTRGAGRGGESAPALPGESCQEEGRGGEVHLLHPAHEGGAPTRVRRGLSHGCPRVRESARSRFRDPMGVGEQAGVPPQRGSGDGAPLLVLHGLMADNPPPTRRGLCT